MLRNSGLVILWCTREWSHKNMIISSSDMGLGFSSLDLEAWKHGTTTQCVLTENLKQWPIMRISLGALFKWRFIDLLANKWELSQTESTEFYQLYNWQSLLDPVMKSSKCIFPRNKIDQVGWFLLCLQWRYGWCECFHWLLFRKKIYGSALWLLIFIDIISIFCIKHSSDSKLLTISSICLI